MGSSELEILTANEACKILKISRFTLYKLITSGQLKARKVGRSYRLLKEDLKTFMKGDDKEVMPNTEASE